MVKKYFAPKVGLALSGGFVRAVASIGVLEVLLESGIEVQAVSGSSSGSLVAAAFASGKLSDLKKFLIGNRDWLHFFNLGISKRGLIEGEEIEKFLSEFFEHKKIENTSIPLFIQVNDLQSGKEVYLNKDSIARAVYAAMSLPGIFTPYKFKNVYLFDGGCYELVPVDVLKKNRCNYIIAVYNNLPPNLFTRWLAKMRKSHKRMDTFLRTYHRPLSLNLYTIIKRALNQASMQLNLSKGDSFSNADIIIRPDLYHIGRFEVNHIDKIILAGRKAASANIKRIKRRLLN